MKTKIFIFAFLSLVNKIKLEKFLQNKNTYFISSKESMLLVGFLLFPTEKKCAMIFSLFFYMITISSVFTIKAVGEAYEICLR